MFGQSQPAWSSPAQHGAAMHGQSHAQYGAATAHHAAVKLGQSQPQYGSYEAPTTVKGSAFFQRGQRRRINATAICLNVFLPWLLFSVNMAVTSFSLHYDHPSLVRFVDVVSFLVVLAALGLAYRTHRKKKMGFSDREPTWFIFAGLMLLVALISAKLCGDMNYSYNMMPYYDVQNLNTYPAVNPAKDRGQQIMDAGRVFFTEGSRLGLDMAMGFKNDDLYCVAPIVQGTEQLTSYDFWAVGVNCCAGVSSDFRCGQFNNGHARSGLRLMEDGQRPFFRLAVQQAEAAYRIKAAHPLFFSWMQDPVAEMNSYRDDGFKYYLLAIFTFFAVNLFAVICATLAFSKIGHY